MAKQKVYALNRTKYLLDQEASKLEELLAHFSSTEPRDTTLISLALQSGARATELLNLRVEHINTTDQTVLIQGIKNSNDRELPLRKSLFHQLTAVCEGKALNDHVFAISYSRLRQIWDLYRPVHKKFHSLRHTFAIRLYKKTKDIRLVQFALGHRNITNTMIYADYIYSQEELKKLIL